MKLHTAVWSVVAAKADKLGQRRFREPEFVPVEPNYDEGVVPGAFPVLQHLNNAISIASQHELAEITRGFAEAASCLAWSQNPTYTEATAGRKLLDGYAYASLSGPDGPIACMSPRGGFFLMGPDVVYPGHNHAPPEIYMLMTPGAQWCLDEGEWFPVDAGDLIFHAPWQMHAMRSGNTPVLAYVAWLEPGDRNKIGWSERAD